MWAMAGDGQGLEVVVFVGLQASGKTSCYRSRFAATHDGSPA
jgi:hypothetical protein